MNRLMDYLGVSRQVPWMSLAMDAPCLLPTLQQVSHHQMLSLTWTNRLPKLASLLCNLPSLCYCVISNREQTKAERGGVGLNQ